MRLAEMQKTADEKLAKFTAEARTKIKADSYADSGDGSREEIVDTTTQKRMRSSAKPLPRRLRTKTGYVACSA